MVSSEKFNAPKLVNGSENRCSFIFDKKIRRTSLVSSYSRYGLRYERLQVIRKIPARDQAAEACLRESASQLPLREHRQPHAHHVDGVTSLDLNDRSTRVLGHSTLGVRWNHPV